MQHIMLNVAMVILMFVWERTIGGIIPLAALERVLTRGSKDAALKM